MWTVSEEVGWYFPQHAPDLLAYDVLLGRYICHNHNPSPSSGAVYKTKGKMKQTTSAVLIRNGTPCTHTCNLSPYITTTSARAELPLYLHG